jgi:hydroxyethylthiazole kinase-like sugar kinase family protein
LLAVFSLSNGDLFDSQLTIAAWLSKLAFGEAGKIAAEEAAGPGTFCDALLEAS